MQRAARNHPGADWTPPVEAWEGELPAVMDASIVYLGCEGDAGPDFRRQVRDALGAADARTHVEYARFETAEGRPTTVAITYWLNRSAYEAWRASDAALRTLDPSAYAGGSGIWTESYAVKRQNIETLFSSDDQSPGFAALAADGVGDPTPLHGYYGSMRDRIWASNDSDHKSDVETVARTALQRPAGEVRITAPKSLCAIRSGQDWSLCEGDQKRLYKEDVEPVLLKGMEYLQQNPEASGCLSCRFMRETDADGRDKDRTFGYAIFREMADLEAWSKLHPTHVAIFGTFMKYAQSFNNEIDLRLWHEVLVTIDEQTFTYNQCGAETGLSPFFAS